MRSLSVRNIWNTYLLCKNKCINSKYFVGPNGRIRRATISLPNSCHKPFNRAIHFSVDRPDRLISHSLIPFDWSISLSINRLESWSLSIGMLFKDFDIFCHFEMLEWVDLHLESLRVTKLSRPFKFNLNISWFQQLKMSSMKYGISSSSNLFDEYLLSTFWRFDTIIKT